MRDCKAFHDLAPTASQVEQPNESNVKSQPVRLPCSEAGMEVRSELKGSLSEDSLMTPAGSHRHRAWL